jgi:hypothetical protein
MESENSPKKSCENTKKRNVTSSKNRKSKEKQNSRNAQEKPRSPIPHTNAADDDTPGQVYSLWGSFKLAVKNINKPKK